MIDSSPMPTQSAHKQAFVKFEAHHTALNINYDKAFSLWKVSQS